MNPVYDTPAQIEERSMQIIAQELGDIRLDAQNELVIKRVIHTTADFEYAKSLYFSPDAVQHTINALKAGADIVCDTNMAKSGINKAALAKLGGQVHCFMAEPDVAKQAAEQGTTRAAVCMERAAALQKPVVFAIGNAPTALIRLHALWQAKALIPAAVIAVPVGFVNVVESKELFVDAGLPAIVARGRKGGSNVAAAICNALLYQIVDRKQLL